MLDRALYAETEGEMIRLWPLAFMPTQEEMLQVKTPLTYKDRRAQYTWRGVTFHSLFYPDGEIWDAVNGFREKGDGHNIQMKYLNEFILALEEEQRTGKLPISHMDQPHYGESAKKHEWSVTYGGEIK